jgi:hypothetical protein
VAAATRVLLEALVRVPSANGGSTHDP